jgi:hypothetical protein
VSSQTHWLNLGVSFVLKAEIIFGVYVRGRKKGTILSIEPLVWQLVDTEPNNNTSEANKHLLNMTNT